jgi:hypothetical protein
VTQLDEITRNVLLRIVVKIVKLLREQQENFESEIKPFVVKGEKWEVGVAYVARGQYQFRTYDPWAAAEIGDRSFTVTGLFTYLEPGDITGESVGEIKPRFHIFTDFYHMIPIMAEILNNFEAIMDIPIRHGNADPNIDMPTEGDT